jgi:hypothetical protein
MLVMSLSPVFGTIGVLGLALIVCIVALLVVSDRTQMTVNDPEREYRILRLKVSGHPVKYRMAKIARWMDQA